MQTLQYKALRWWARLLLRLEQWDSAQAVFERMGQMRPEDDYPLASIAYLHTITGRKNEAFTMLLRLTQTHSQVGMHWFNLGFLQEEKSQFEEACASFQKAVELRPDIDRAWYGLGLVLIRLQRLDEAVKALKQNTKLQPMSPYGWYQLARVHMDRQQPDEARKIIRHLKGFEPKVAAQLERETGISVSPAS
ncbi:tetratricopeptide repeat protein [Variovorax sp. PCZ-1]|nr:tetratricopeptide repeat protein [Variovorax sp. PCZ-1]